MAAGGEAWAARAVRLPVTRLRACLITMEFRQAAAPMAAAGARSVNRAVVLRRTLAHRDATPTTAARGRQAILPVAAVQAIPPCGTQTTTVDRAVQPPTPAAMPGRPQAGARTMAVGAPSATREAATLTTVDRAAPPARAAMKRRHLLAAVPIRAEVGGDLAQSTRDARTIQVRPLRRQIRAVPTMVLRDAPKAGRLGRSPRAGPIAAPTAEATYR